jgi:alkaline phosphatase
LYIKDKAHKALDDFVSFDNAVGDTLARVSLKDTMVVVTADHSHTFTLGGWTFRGNPVYGEFEDCQSYHTFDVCL